MPLQTTLPARHQGDAMLAISIPKWDKYNARKDRANFTWFRFENNFFHDQTIFNLTDSQILLFQFLLCEASKKNSGEIELRPKYIAAVRRKSVEEIIKDFEAIIEAGMVTAERRLSDGALPAESRRLDGVPPSLSLATNERTNEHTTTTENQKKLDPELKTQIQEAFEVWNETLSTFGVDQSPINSVQEMSLARAIRQLGFEASCLALEGQRYEDATETFTPSKHLSLDRVLHRDAKGKSRWEQFRNMALAARKRHREHHEAIADAVGLPPSSEHNANNGDTHVAQGVAP